MFNFDDQTTLAVKNIALYGLKAGVNIYFVGGMVRDVLMGIEIQDIDILIEGSAIDFVQGFYENFKDRLDIEIKSIHKSFDTAKTVINGIEIDFASTREEDYPKSGCLPVVKNIGCDIRSDLKRRDFTINAIAAKILLENDCLKYEIIDEFFGKKDIKPKELKVLHQKSYIDDPTRILRGIDFNLRFGFDFSSYDKKLIQECLKAPDREGLSIDRVKLTLKKLFSNTKRAKEAYKYILENKIYKIWQNESISKIQWADKLYESAEIFNICTSDIFLEAIVSPPVEKMPQNTSNYEIYSFYKPFSTLEMALQWAIYGYNEAKFYFEKLKDIKPEITGADIIKLGFCEGKIIGEILNCIQKEKLNNLSKFKKRQDEIDFVLKIFN